jgi:glutamine amidotransferase
MRSIAVIDYGMGNLRSVVNALQVVTEGRDQVLLTSDPAQVLAADRQQPFLGICMGLQVLIDHSEENQGTDCLGIYPGEVRYFGDSHRDQGGVKLKVPHMGWNRVVQTQSHPLWHSIDDGSRFYFVHSYYLEAADPELVAGQTDYGFNFTSAIAKDNLFALQCHPEKSAGTGLQLLRNFVNWDGQA